MRIWQIISLGLLLPVVGQAGGGGQSLTKAQKDALLSRKIWYLSASFSVKGSGSGDGSNWTMDNLTTLTLDLNHAIPGQWPPSAISDPTALAPDQPGRFMTWMAMPTEAAMAAAERGDTNPANQPNFYYPTFRTVNHRHVSQAQAGSEIDTFTGVSPGYAIGVCMLALDLKTGKYDLVFQVGPTDHGQPIRHQWDYPEPPDGKGDGSMDAVPTQHMAWMDQAVMPQLAARSLPGEMKQDGSIEFTILSTRENTTFGSGPVNCIAKFRISPTPPSTARLFIEPADPPRYREWRPKPGRSEIDPGNSLEIKYVVEEPGVPPAKQAKVNKVTLRLGNVSNYPGVCMNWPLAPTPPSKPDLRFKPMADTPTIHYSMGPENETVTIAGAELGATPRSGKVTVECFDGAAIGEIVAEAELNDGRVLTAEVRGQTASRKLLIPDREEGVSDIARYWRNKYAPGQEDGEDEEDDPEGDGQKGDGLTLWEEYRGLRQGGAWRDNCEPKKKDLFIENKVGGTAEPGIRLFMSATGLAVHSKLSDKEHQQDRKINFNKRADRHVADQHCLVLRESSDPNAGTAQQQFGAVFPGPPKNTLWVNVVMGLPADRIFGTHARGQFVVGNYDNSMVAHELGHAVAMYHHGDIDPWTNNIFGELWTRSPNASGAILRAGVPIRVVAEPSGRVLDPPDFGFLPNNLEHRAYMGYPNGQHSGDFNCIMRYAVARYYVQTAVPNSRVYHGTMEHPGLSFCDSPAGTDFNQQSNLPNSRYGDADTSHSRGDCKHQFVISDRWNAKVRLAPEPVSFLLPRSIQ